MAPRKSSRTNKKLTTVRRAAETRFGKIRGSFGSAYDENADVKLQPLGRAAARLKRCKLILQRQIAERCAIQRAVAIQYDCREMLSLTELDKLEAELKGWVSNAVLALQQRNANDFHAAGTVPPSAITASHERIALEIPAGTLSLVSDEIAALRAEGSAWPRTSTLGRNIDRLRRECGWTFDQLSEATNFEKALIVGHVHGKGASVGTLRIYADIFSKRLGRDVTIPELEGRTS